MFALPPHRHNFLTLNSDRNNGRRLLTVSVALAALAMSNAACAGRLWSTEVSQDYVTDQGTYIYDGDRAVIWNFPSHNTLTIDASIVNIQARERAIYASDSAVVNILSDSSVLLSAGSASQTEKAPSALYLQDNAQANIQGNTIEIHATASNKDARAVDVRKSAIGSSSATIGSTDTQKIVISADGSANSYGVVNNEGHVLIQGNEVKVYSSGIGIHAGNNTQDAVRPKDTASTIIKANRTVINADSYGILAFSNGIVDISGDLTVNAPVALAVRGHSLTTINASGKDVVVLKGNISFETTGVDGGNIIDADVSINLSGAASSWTGNVVTEIPEDHPAKDSVVSGFKLTLSDGAQWNATKIETTDFDYGDKTLVNSSEPLDSLTINGGVVNVQETDQVLQIETIAGTGGTINLAATAETQDNSITTAKLELGNSTGESPVALVVNYEGITSDDLTEENVKTLDGLTGEGAEKTEVVEYVQEGDIRGVWTRSDGNEAGTYGDNTKLESFKGVNASALVQWRNQINHLTKRLGDVRHQSGDIGAWARVYGGEYEWGDANRVDMQTTTVQVGGDARVGDWIVGGAFSYSDSSYDLENGGGDGDLYSLAVYGTRTFEKGSYVDFVARYGYIKNDIKAGNMDVDFDSNAFSLSVEGGHTFKFMERAYVEPQIEVTYGFAQGDDATASNGVKIEQDDYQNLITRIGFRTGFDFPNEAGTIYAHASYSYDFLGEADGTASQNGLRASLDEDLGGGWVTYGIGGQFRLGESTFAYGELERSTGGDVDNPWAFNIGVRHLF